MSKQTITREWNSVEIQELLWDYSEWLNKHGYIDSDFYTEEPHAIDAYLEDKQSTRKGQPIG